MFLKSFDINSIAHEHIRRFRNRPRPHKSYKTGRAIRGGRGSIPRVTLQRFVTGGQTSSPFPFQPRTRVVSSPERNEKKPLTKLICTRNRRTPVPETESADRPVPVDGNAPDESFSRNGVIFSPTTNDPGTFYPSPSTAESHSLQTHKLFAFTRDSGARLPSIRYSPRVPRSLHSRVNTLNMCARVRGYDVRVYENLIGELGPRG